jgi:hypothetical protein
VIKMGIETFEYSSTVNASNTKSVSLSIKRGSIIPKSHISCWLRSLSAGIQFVINLKKKNSDFRIPVLNDLSSYTGTNEEDQDTASNESVIYVPDLEGDWVLDILVINDTASNCDFQINGVIITPDERPKMISESSVREINQLPFASVNI